MLFTGPLEVFFKSPGEQPTPEGDSVLYHLRTGLEQLWGPEGTLGGPCGRNVLLATMGALSGLDLLSQGHYGGPGSADKFVSFLTSVGKLNVTDAETIYQLRCGLLHSASLSAVSRRHPRVGHTYSFTVVDGASDPLIHLSQDSGSVVEYSVGFWSLKSLFVEAIVALEKLCGVDQVVLNNVCRLAAEKIVQR